MTDDDLFELSRRKALAGLGTIGIASAGAGLGTSAFFSDTESFDGNMITAGELDLAVDYVVHEYQGSAGKYTINSFEGTVNGSEASQAVTLDGPSTISQDLDDLKPGDKGYSYFCFEIDDNPAYLWACGELTANNENGQNEAEDGTDGDGESTDTTGGDPGAGEGELADAIQVTVSYCSIDTAAPPDYSAGDTLSGGTQITSGTLAEVLDELDGGIPLDGTGSAGVPSPGSQAPYDGTSNSSGVTGVTNPCICFEWHVPTSVGNEIQSDSVKFDLEFNAQQARHNDGSNNPCLEGRTGTGFAKDRSDFSPSLNARGRFGDNDPGTTTGLRELDIRDPSDAPQAQGGHAWSSGTAEAFELSYDGTTATLEVGGDPVSTSAVSPSDDDLAIGVGASGGTVEVTDVKVNGQTPGGASSVSASGGNAYLFVAGGGLSAGDSVTGMVEFTWSGSPSQEGLKFRIDT
jgi:predicted ribosomally synthesized peptide with SipW-like signal peptide